jgi:hypothetical protein
MSREYQIEIKSNVVVVRFVNSATHAVVIKAIDDIAKLDAKLRLWELSKGLNASPEEMLSLARYGKTKLVGEAKIALVAPADCDFGLSKIHEIYRGQPNFEEKIFRIEQVAMDWLLSE